MKIDMTSFFSAEGGPIWIKFHRLVQNDMSTAVIWSQSKPGVEFQYGGRLSEFNMAWTPATLQGVIISSAILKVVFRHILFMLFFMQFGLRRAASLLYVIVIACVCVMKNSKKNIFNSSAVRGCRH